MIIRSKIYNFILDMKLSLESQLFVSFFDRSFKMICMKSTFTDFAFIALLYNHGSSRTHL